MESMRDVKRVMEREAAKGSCPLSFERLEYGECPFRPVGTEEKLDEVLSYLLRVGDYGKYAEKTTINNVYMDLDLLCRKPQFRRTHSVMERREIYGRVQRYRNRLKPDYAGKVYLETIQCCFRLPEGEADRYRMTYQGEETYGFIMSNKYILGLFTCCEAARKSLAADGVGYAHLAEEEQRLALLDGVRDVLFQALLLDNVSMENQEIKADMCSIFLLD